MVSVTLYGLVRRVWCSIHYALWSGADWSGVVSVTLYGLVPTGLVASVKYMVWCGLAWYGLLWSMVWHNLVWCKVAMVYSRLVCDGEDFGTYCNGGGVREKYNN